MVIEVEEEEGSLQLVRVAEETEAEVEEDRTVFGSLGETSAAAHIGVVAVVVEELLRHIVVSFIGGHRELRVS